MKKHILLASLFCLLISCTGKDDQPIPYTGPTGDVVITDPTSDDSYTTLSDKVTLLGSRRPSVSSVDWSNLSTNATGTGMVLDYPDECFFFGFYPCTKYYWGATIPLQHGENVIKIFANGSWADSITVTRTPAFDVSGAITFNGAGQLNIKATLVDAADPARTFTAYTDQAGSYRFTLITAGTYSLTPADACYTFSPACRDVTVLSADTGSMDFSIVAKPYATVSGRVTWTSTGSGAYGAAVKLTSQTTLAEAGTATANPDGFFTFTCVPDGLYSVAVIPGFQGLTLAGTPASISVEVSGQDRTNIDFQASLVNQTYGIAGQISQ